MSTRAIFSGFRATRTLPDIRQGQSFGSQFSLRCSGSFGSQPGVGTNQQLVEFMLRCGFMAEHSADKRAEKSERNAENARVLQREPRLRLNQVAGRTYDCGWINRHQAGAHENQSDGRDETGG